MRQGKAANGSSGGRLAAQVYANGEKLDSRTTAAMRVGLGSQMHYEARKCYGGASICG